MKKHLIILACIGGLFFFGCSKSDNPQPTPTPSVATPATKGTWQVSYANSSTSNTLSGTDASFDAQSGKSFWVYLGNATTNWFQIFIAGKTDIVPGMTFQLSGYSPGQAAIMYLGNDKTLNSQRTLMAGGTLTVTAVEKSTTPKVSGTFAYSFLDAFNIQTNVTGTFTNAQ